MTLRALLVAVTVTGCSSQGSNGTAKMAALVTWKAAWSNPLRSSLIVAGGVVVLREDGAVPRSTGVDPVSGKVRWRADALVESPDEKTLYTVTSSEFEFVVNKIDPMSGQVTWSRRISRASGLEYAVVLNDLVLAIDRKHVRAVALADNATLWDQSLPIDDHAWVRQWGATALFQTPYTAVAVDTGASQWHQTGCCVAAPLTDTRALLQQEGVVLVIAQGGKTVRSIPGKVVAAGAGGAVLEDSVGLRVYFADSDQDVAIKLPGGPARGSVAFDHGFVYYTTVDGAVMEFDIRANTASEIRAATARSVPVDDDILVPPVVSHDRVYVSDDGWHAFDRSQPRPR